MGMGGRRRGGVSREALDDEELMGSSEELDMGEPGLEDIGGEEDLGMGLGDEEGLGDEGSDLQEVDTTVLRRVLDEVESGQKSADEAYDECCGEGMDMGAEDMGGMDDMGMDDMDMDDMGGEEDLDLGEEAPMQSYSECMENVTRIANMLTEDPDIFE